MKSRTLSVKVQIWKARPHRHDAEITRQWRELRKLVAERFSEMASEARVGKKRTPATRKAIASGVAAAWADPEKRERMSAQRGGPRSAEWRENQRLAQRKSHERRRAKNGTPADKIETRIFRAAA